MKRILNLTKVPAGITAYVQADASSRLDRIAGRLERMSDDLAKVSLTVQPYGRNPRGWEAKVLLRLPTEVFSTHGESMVGPQDAIREALDEIEQMVHRHVERVRREGKRTRRKSREQERLRQMEANIEDKLVASAPHSV